MADETIEKTNAPQGDVKPAATAQAAPAPNNSAEATKAKLDEFKDESHKSAEETVHPNMDVILEIPVSISMEVGRTNISIRNLLKLSQGSVVELDRFAGDPLDVFVNGTLIAHGEVVVVNEKFGIRLTDVISQAERIKKLGDHDV